MKALVVTVSPDRVDIAADTLWSMGVLAVEERHISSHEVELWTSLGDDSTDVDLPYRWRFEQVDDEVVNTWRHYAQPVWVQSDLVVCPAWVDADFEAHVTVLYIDPGTTFGLGDHATTRLSMQALRAEVRPGHRVLDVGSGSGVLSLAARRFGASSATATDIAAAAVSVGRANAARNHIDGIWFTTAGLPTLAAPYDVVVANILAPVLVELSEQLVRLAGQVLIVSGVLDAAYDHVAAAMAPMEVRAVHTLDGWAALVLHRQ
jgi:ribosomal protein L11 methyltransferase